MEDFLESLTESPGPAQAELVNCILRCCGCNDTVDEDAAVDYDGVVDALDNFTEALKQVCGPASSVLQQFLILGEPIGQRAPLPSYF